MTGAILELDRVGKAFLAGGRKVQALDDVSLTVDRGGCHAIVGESGSGKSTLGNLVLGVLRPTAGTLTFDGAELPARRPLVLKRRIQLVQQNPLSSLNPKRSVGASLRLALDVHRLAPTAQERRARIGALLEEVGLDADLAHRAPASLSGGQRQRVAIARALACQPELIVLDEPTSALDVLVQARVLRLLADLRAWRGLTYLFITHDLAIVRNLADGMSVFEKGRLVESGPVEAVFRAPKHPYTARLIGSIPVVTPEEAAVRDAAALIADQTTDAGAAA